MADNRTTERLDEGCDATHRASNLDTHLTHVCIQLFCHFFGGLCARPLFPRSKTGSNQTYYERVNGALWKVLS